MGKAFDQKVVSKVESLFIGENLLETILHGHLLVERALTENIAE
jgi:hypothetical protein